MLILIFFPCKVTTVVPLAYLQNLLILYVYDNKGCRIAHKQ